MTASLFQLVKGNITIILFIKKQSILLEEKRGQTERGKAKITTASLGPEAVTFTTAFRQTCCFASFSCAKYDVFFLFCFFSLSIHRAEREDEGESWAGAGVPLRRPLPSLLLVPLSLDDHKRPQINYSLWGAGAKTIYGFFFFIFNALTFCILTTAWIKQFNPSFFLLPCKLSFIALKGHTHTFYTLVFCALLLNTSHKWSRNVTWSLSLWNKANLVLFNDDQTTDVFGLTPAPSGIWEILGSVSRCGSEEGMWVADPTEENSTFRSGNIRRVLKETWRRI